MALLDEAVSSEPAAEAVNADSERDSTIWDMIERMWCVVRI